jgi:hypothetical protein
MPASQADRRRVGKMTATLTAMQKILHQAEAGAVEPPSAGRCVVN